MHEHAHCMLQHGEIQMFHACYYQPPHTHSPYLFKRVAPQELHEDIGMELIEGALDQFLQGIGIGLLCFAHLLQSQ